MNNALQERNDPLKKRYFSITAIVAVMFLVALSGYLRLQAKHDVPARVIMDNNGGRVIFTHQAHAQDYGFECADCHHDNIGQDQPLACGSCHPSAFDEKFRVEHQKTFPNDEACMRCHSETPTGPLAKEDKPDTEIIPTRADAFHNQCMSCHEESGGPYGKDSCYDCHAR